MRKLTKKMPYEKLATIACELQARVVWALNFMRCDGSGVVATRTPDGGFKTDGHWTKWFADGAEMLGHYKIDRELLGKSQKEQQKILKQREKSKEKK